MRQQKYKSRGELLNMSPLIAVSATIRGQRGKTWLEKRLIGALLLLWVTN